MEISASEISLDSQVSTTQTAVGSYVTQCFEFIEFWDQAPSIEVQKLEVFVEQLEFT